MHKNWTKTVVVMLSVLVLLSVSCNGSQQAESGEVVNEGVTAQLDAVSNLEETQSAVVQIVATGTFKDPEEGTQLNAAGSGSGFIIDPSGIAITNNHVVTGASFLQVFIQGEDEPRNAKIVAVSECSDLAVINIDGEGFPYLQWYEGDIKVGMDVFTAGFPLGDPEFTLTKGIVSKANANGETSWASIDKTIEHDATINPGNSGGPLINENGQVVGVNYAGSLNTNQYFAISRDEVLSMLDTLLSGQDVNSIGVNGYALTSKLAGGLGIWVSSVETGSPASHAGVQPGDIIIKLQEFNLKDISTMEEYCNIIRSHDVDSVMSIDVIRISSDNAEILSGELNGEELQVDLTVPLNAAGQSGTAVNGTDNVQAGTVGTASFNINLIQNPGNEEPLENGEIPFWEEAAGNNWGKNSEVPVYEGRAYFDAGEAGQYAVLRQTIDVSGFAASIDQGNQEFAFAAYMRSYPLQTFVPVDSAQVFLEFLNADGEELDTVQSEEYFSQRVGV
ncbi:MAG: trypsin-like peptidase domain-containing protein [Chloroflexota bacterium]